LHYATSMKTGPILVAFLAVAACTTRNATPDPDAGLGDQTSPDSGDAAGAGGVPSGTGGGPGTGGVPSGTGGGPGTGGCGGASGSTVCGGLPGTGGGPAPTPVPDPLYQLVGGRSFPTPIEDARGITFDGTSLWVLHSAIVGPTQLVELNPATLAIGRRVDGPVRDPGQLDGLAWDGLSFWVGSSDGPSKQILQVALAGGLLQKLSPTITEPPVDLDFDGRDLWLLGGLGTMSLVDRTTGAVKRSFPSFGSTNGPGGIAFRPGEVWAGAMWGGLDVYDPETGKHQGGVITAAGLRLGQDDVGPFCFMKDQLIILTQHSIDYHHLKRLR
jgi:hypothetical protein